MITTRFVLFSFRSCFWGLIIDGLLIPVTDNACIVDVWLTGGVSVWIGIWVRGGVWSAGSIWLGGVWNGGVWDGGGVGVRGGVRRGGEEAISASLERQELLLDFGWEVLRT